MAHLRKAALTPVPAMPSRDVAHEHVDHRVGDVHAERLAQARAAVVEEEGHVAVGVAAGRDDDVEVGHLLGDALDAGDVAAQPDHGRVDDRRHALGGERLQLRDGVGDPLVLVPHSSG